MFLRLLPSCQTLFGLGLALRLDGQNRTLAQLEDMEAYRAKILQRFAEVDADGDSTVTLEEMRAGFLHDPVHSGQAVLTQMLSACAGRHSGAISCNQYELEAALEAWVSSPREQASVALLMTDARDGFVEVRGREGEKELTGDRCGPSVLDPHNSSGFPQVQCTWSGPKCWGRNMLAAWSLNEICSTRGCLCEATPETKRLAKLGLMGALGVSTVSNISDLNEELELPGCGHDWHARKVLGKIHKIDSNTSIIDKAIIRLGTPLVVPNETIQKRIYTEQDDDTEVALYRSRSHQIVKNGQPRKVCMMSWQATRSPGDWKTNLLVQDVSFPYAPRAAKMRAPKGLVMAYESTRNVLMEAFHEECCSDDFLADKVVISGHSHGGALAELHAIDAVTNWRCRRDLGARDLAVVLVAPHALLLTMRTVNNVFSCSDPANCLSGSAVTLVSQNDIVGDALFLPIMPKRHPPFHPTVTTRVSCIDMPPDAFPWAKADLDIREQHKWWCHGLHNYVPAVEEHLVGRAGWGSSCGGHCGNPNRMLQCYNHILLNREGCVYAPARKLELAPACPDDRWIEAEERCDCPIKSCIELHPEGCMN